MLCPKTGGYYANCLVRHAFNFQRRTCASIPERDLLSSDRPLQTVKHLHEVKPVDRCFVVQGWVKNLRKQKKNTFIDFNDGTYGRVLQMVLPTEHLPKGLTIGSTIVAEGTLKSSTHPKQPIEFVPDKITMSGKFMHEGYPVVPLDVDPLQYMRSFIHLRPRHEVFSSILKIRNCATMKIHEYFQKNGYYLIHAPILTNNDAEGGGSTFKVTALKSDSQPDNEDSSNDADTDIDDENLDGPIDDKKSLKLFDSDVLLSVTGQLQLESVVCAGLPKVYSFGPIFRAENQISRSHLSEFYMVEAEVAFAHTLEDILQVIEDMIRSTCNAVYEACTEDVQTVERYLKTQNSERVCRLLKNRFIRLTYTEAIKLLNEKSNNLDANLSWGQKLKRKHELELVRLCGDVPVFVTEYPSAVKAFYMKATDKGDDTVDAADLLLPEIGELCGGSLREDRVHVLEQKIEDFKLCGNLQWYIDLRKFGSVPHGGFGLGFERLLRLITGMNNVKDVIPFPRWPHHCQT